MKLPPIDFSKLVNLLKKEGGAELGTLKPTPQPGKLMGALGMAPVLEEWNKIIRILELEIVPLLAKGCESKLLVAPAKKLASSAGHLSLMASQILSFVPGPIGILCSLINAIVCFSTGNVVGGFLELLGCVPGAKAGVKGGTKLFKEVKKIVTEMLQNNKSLWEIIEAGGKGAEKLDYVIAELEKRGFTADRAEKLKAIIDQSVSKIGPKPSAKIDTPKIGCQYGMKKPSQPSAFEQTLAQPLHPKTQSKSTGNYYGNDYYARSEIGKYTMSPGTYGSMLRPKF